MNLDAPSIGRVAKWQQDSSDLARIVDGADFSDPEPGVTLSSAQVWGRLLRMTREEREKWFGMQQEASVRGMTCLLHDHGSLVEAYGLMNDAAHGYRIAAIAQKAEADEWHARFKRVLALGHQWRQRARRLGGGTCEARDSGGAYCRRHWNHPGGHRA